MEPHELNISRTLGNRQVWVLNRGEHTYVEKFRGTEISVPPHHIKEVKMPYLAANRFLHQMTQAAESMKLPNGQLTGVPKSLYIAELTEAELKDAGISKAEMAKQAKIDESKAALTCTVCGIQATTATGLKIHTTKAHPDHVPVRDE